jgi:hypothetical protein
LLPLLPAPLGYLTTRILDFSIPQHALAMVPIGLPTGMILVLPGMEVFGVSSLNAELGVVSVAAKRRKRYPALQRLVGVSRDSAD